MNLILRNIIILIIFLSAGVFGAEFRITTPDSDISQAEGNSGAQNVNFKVRLYATGSGDGRCIKNTTYTVQYHAVDGTAKLSDNDYGNPTGTGTISITYKGDTRNSGQCGEQTFSVPVNGDITVEPNEDFTVSLYNQSSNAFISTTMGSRTITITNDDTPPPVFSVANTSAYEGDSSSDNTALIFQVNLSGQCVKGRTYTVHYDTIDGVGVDGAKAGQDYDATSGSVSITPTTTGTCNITKTVSVPLIEDMVQESDTPMLLQLSSPTNATLSTTNPMAVGTIVNDDFGARVFSITNPAPTNEGDSGTHNLPFTISLSGTCVAGKSYTVHYETSDGTAEEGNGDYTATSGTATITQGSTTGPCGTTTINVPIRGDTTAEMDEAFKVKLTSPGSGTTIDPAYQYGIGVIVNDDGAYSAETFGSRYTINLQGNMKTIGNTVLAPKNGTGGYISDSGNRNDKDDLRYVDVDKNIFTFNSSVAKLTDSAIVPTAANPTPAKVKWAGLYWSGYLHTYDSSDIDGDDANIVKLFTRYKTLTDFASIENVINTHTVKLTTPDGITHNIDSHTVLGMEKYRDSSSYAGYSYGCFADVTSLMKDKDPEGNYTVANIPSMEGATEKDGLYDDGLGNSGAWTLVVVYENDSVGEKVRNVSVFDGFTQITSSKDAIINVSGFKTPKGGDIDSTLSIFANEGDKHISGDRFIFTNKDGDKVNNFDVFENSTGATDNYFDSFISGVPSRTPSLTNNNGIDIHTEQLGTTGYNVIGTNQTKAEIRLTSTGDYYYPVVIGFATQLATPKLCYDYAATLDTRSMSSSDLTFTPSSNGNTLTAKVFIRALDSDFDLERTQLSTAWSDITPPNPVATFNYLDTEAKVQPPGQIMYIPATQITGKTQTISIGRNNSDTGGMLGRQESVYAKMPYSVTAIAGRTVKLSVSVSGQYALDSNNTGLTPFNASTDGNTLTRCEGSFAYNPLWYQFNVENVSGGVNLYTQVTGTPYNVQVASYDPDNISTRKAYTGVMEIELFDVPKFQSNDKIIYKFDEVCEEDVDPKPWPSLNGKKLFVNFNNDKSISLPIDENDNKYAIKNAALKLWILTKGKDENDNIIINNQKCNNGSFDLEACAKEIYSNTAEYAANSDVQNACTIGTDKECYKMMKAHFGQPICSRDNFAIRPYGIQLEAKSGTATIQKNDTVASKIANLISGLFGDYKVEMIAKGKNGITTEGYDIDKTANVLFDKLGEVMKFFGLEFDDGRTNGSAFNAIPSYQIDHTKCDDSSHLGLSGKNSPLNPDITQWDLNRSNVGNYNVILFDKDWAMVDRADYAYKAPASKDMWDCDKDKAIYVKNGLNGCDVRSYDIDTVAQNDSSSPYKKIPVKFVPAKIDISGLAHNSYPAHSQKWAYMNRLSSDSGMGARFTGIIVAKNANSAATTNFTVGCMAQNVNLSNQYSTTQLDDSGVVKAENTDGTTIQSGDKFYLQYTSSVNGGSFSAFDPVPSKSTTDTSDGTNYDYIVKSQAQKNDFTDVLRGSLLYDIRYNIYKLYYAAVNPIKVLFVKLTSELIDNETNQPLVVWKDGKEETSITDENRYFNGTAADVDKDSFRFIYGRVYTALEAKDLSEGTPVLGASTAKDFEVGVYSVANPAGDSVLKDALGDPVDGLSNWYNVKTHSPDDPSGSKFDGQIESIAQSPSQGATTIAPSSTNILYDQLPSTSRRATADVTYSYSGKRSNLVIYTVYPTIWLKYNSDKNKNGLPQFALNFVQPGYNWVGKGNTGNVINIPVTPNAKHR